MDIIKVDTFFDEIIIGEDLIQEKQWIQLGDLMGEDIKKTKYWDLNINQPLNICVPSNKDFETIYIYEKEAYKEIKIYSRLHRLLSLSYFQVEKIGKINDEIFIKTKNLFINLKNALLKKELTFIKDKKVDKSSFLEQDLRLIDKILLSYKDLELGVVDEQDLLWSSTLDYASYVNEQKKWKINHKISILDYYY